MSFVGFVILILLVLLVIWIYVELGAIPGKTAIERGHPQAEAINVLAWTGLLMGAVPWLVALVWAYTKPVAMKQGSLDAQVQPEPDAHDKNDP